jgi:hypothetical protein
MGRAMAGLGTDDRRSAQSLAPVDTQVNLVRLRSNTVLVRNTIG